MNDMLFDVCFHIMSSVISHEESMYYLPKAGSNIFTRLSISMLFVKKLVVIWYILT